MKSSLHRSIQVLTAVVAASIVLTTPAIAKETNLRDPQIMAEARYVLVRGDTRVRGTDPTRSVHYELPTCWYAPGNTPEELLSAYEGNLQAGQLSRIPVYPTEFHLREAGIWWSPVCRQDATFEEFWAYRVAHWDDFYRWVATGDGTPDEGIDYPDLLKIAREFTELLPVAIASSPKAGAVPSTVFLPTWLWVDRGAWEKPATVTASVPTMEVTTRARRKYLLIDAGTSSDRAEVHADTTFNGKAACSLGGSPYAGDATAMPPCGVTYKRSTAGSGPYSLQVSVVWEVSWTRNGRDMGLVTEDPYITVEAPAMNVVVREVQTVVSSAY